MNVFLVFFLFLTSGLFFGSGQRRALFLFEKEKRNREIESCEFYDFFFIFEIIKTTFIITLDSIDFFVTKRILTAVGEHRILLGAPAKGLGAIRNLLYKM
jgi:hypothetical protein